MPQVRALVVTNMYPTPARPALGSFVRDQVDALRRIGGIEVEVFAFAPGGTAAYLKAARDLRRAQRHEHFDVVHAHFGLTAWPAFAAPGGAHAVTLHGTDLVHPRSRAITLAALPFEDLVATVSEPLATQIPGWATRKQRAVLPAGVDVTRFKPIPRAQARTQLGLDPNGPYLLFPADPARPEKRYDRATALAGDTPLLALGNIDPQQVPLWVNAANAVLVPSERESYGLAVLEALACDVPVLATPMGIAPEALSGIDGTHCGSFDEPAWREALEPHLQATDPRIDGRARAERNSTDRMAANVVAAWQSLS
ncbi:MAG TPA: glycosyltransferase [Solirubrobacteraceae bacterium]|nr:glycosyltransferase [Solirubrobacteraceae bacterium]